MNEMTEHLDVVVVGAGLSGVAAGRYLQAKCPWAKFAVLEARGGSGGTWDLFRYPGIRSDSDMYTLGYSFRPWRGDKTIVDGGSILEYIRDTASETGLDEHIRLNRQVRAASWSSDGALWRVQVENTDTGERSELTCSFVFSCTGYYRYDHGYEPRFEGIEDFEGTVVHPQAWPSDLDYAGKRVVVIGSGATAITLIPSMSEKAAHVTMLQRSPTYVAAIPSTNPVAYALHRILPKRAADVAVRWFHALFTQGFYQVSQRHPEPVKRLLRRGLKRELPKGFPIDPHFTPTYKPWDQRFCVAPDGDLFKAIRSGKVSIVTDHIERFTPRGLALRSGEELEAEVVVTATGLELLFAGGVQLSVDGQPVEVSTKLTYKGMMLEGVPNFAIAIGYVNASWTLKCEFICDYVCRLLNYMRAEGLSQCTPVNENAVDIGKPVLDLTSGYVRRAVDRLPKQGSKFPWRTHNSFVRDYRTLKRRPVHDEGMVFSSSARGRVRAQEPPAVSAPQEAAPQEAATSSPATAATAATE